MGLSTTLSNALSGLSVTQSSLDVLSRNIANSGTPGYHRQSVNSLDYTGTSSNYAVSSGVTRAFDQSLQVHYTNEVSDSSASSVQSTYLNQLQTYIGKPGDSGSLATVFGKFQSALTSLTASPDDYSTRATAVSAAQSLASTLNELTTQVQGLRQEANGQIQTDVDSVNQSLASLEKINTKLADQNIDSGSRATLLDQRDQLVSKVASVVDVKASYRTDGSVALSTRSGVGLLDGKASVFQFQPVTNISANSEFNTDDTQNGVGKLTLLTPSGLSLDLVKQNVLQSGELAGLVNLRDNTLVQAQAQLDGIAAGAGAIAVDERDEGNGRQQRRRDRPVGRPVGRSVGQRRPHQLHQRRRRQAVRLVRVDDASKLPMDYVDAGGTRVVGASFSGGATGVAGVLQAAIGASVAVSGTGSTLTVLNDGTANTAVSGVQTADHQHGDAECRARGLPVRGQRQCRVHQQRRRQGTKARLCRAHRHQLVDPFRQHQFRAGDHGRIAGRCDARQLPRQTAVDDDVCRSAQQQGGPGGRAHRHGQRPHLADHGFPGQPRLPPPSTTAPATTMR